MSYRLPKEYRSLVYSELTGFDPNDFDVERLLPTLYDVIVTGGRERATPKADFEQYRRYVAELAEHPNMAGFDSEPARRALDVLVHSGIARVATKSLKRNTAQLDYIQPLHLLTYRSGLPKIRSRHRRVHTILYEAFRARLSAAGEPDRPALRSLLLAAVGRGATLLDAAHDFDAAYDGESEVDLTTLVAFYYLDAFEPGAIRTAKEPARPDLLALPAARAVLADDLLGFLAAHRDLPELAIARHLMALINFELFAYTLRLMTAVERIVADPSDSSEFLDPEARAETELYVDFTRQRGGASDELARTCVNRDLERCRRFFEAELLLRETEKIVRFQPAIAEPLKDLPTHERFPALAQLIASDLVNMGAGMELSRIEQAIADDSESDSDELRAAIEATPGSQIHKLASLLANQPGSRGVENLVKWVWSTGGLRKPFGLLRGNLRGPRNWRYAMTDDLLAAVVQVAFLRYPPGRPHQADRRSRLSLQELLSQLENRYGVIVARPPRELDTAENRRAADDNLAAFKSRLRQLGFFEALSDDFTAQYLAQPHVGDGK